MLFWKFCVLILISKVRGLNDVKESLLRNIFSHFLISCPAVVGGGRDLPDLPSLLPRLG